MDSKDDYFVRVWMMNGEIHYINLNGVEPQYTALCGKTINVKDISAFTPDDDKAPTCEVCRKAMEGLR